MNNAEILSFHDETMIAIGEVIAEMDLYDDEKDLLNDEIDTYDRRIKEARENIDDALKALRNIRKMIVQYKNRPKT